MMNHKQIFLLFLTLAQTVLMVKSAEATATAETQGLTTAYLEDMSLGCTGDLSNYYFNLKPLTKELKPDDRKSSEVYQLDFETDEGTNSIEFNFCATTAR